MYKNLTSIFKKYKKKIYIGYGIKQDIYVVEKKNLSKLKTTFNPPITNVFCYVHLAKERMGG